MELEMEKYNKSFSALKAEKKTEFEVLSQYADSYCLLELRKRIRFL